AGGVHAVTGFLRGRPRGRFRATTTPWTNSSPPQTPHGSRRSLAPARQASTSGQVRQRDLAYSTSAGDSAKKTSGSYERQGTGTPRFWLSSSSAVSSVSDVKVGSSVEPGLGIVSEGGTDGSCASSCKVRLPRLVVSGRSAGMAAGTGFCSLPRGAFFGVVHRSWTNRRAADPGWGSAALKAPA